MSIFSQKNGIKSIPRSIYIKILVFFCLIGFSALALHPIQTALSITMNEIKENVINDLEETLRIGIRYASIRPAFFGSFEIRNLKLYKEGRNFFSVSRVNVRFSLIKLITGNKAAIHTVNIERPLLRIDFQKDADLFNNFKISQQTHEDSDIEDDILFKIAEYLPKNIDYKIHDGSMLFVNGNFVYQFDKINIDVRGDKYDILLDTTLNAEIRYTGFRDRTIIFNTNVDLKSMGDSRLQSINSDILFTSIKCSEQRIDQNYSAFFRSVSAQERLSLIPIFSVRSFNLNLSYKDRIFYLDKKHNNQNINYAFLYDFKSGRINAFFNIVNFIPNTIIDVHDEIINISHLLDIPVNGEFEFTQNENSERQYNVNYKAGNNIDSFIINAHGTENAIFINEASVFSSKKNVAAGLFEGEIKANGDILFNPFLPKLELYVADFSMTGKETLNANFEIKGQDNYVTILGHNILIGDIKLDEFFINLNILENDTLISASLVCQNDGMLIIDSVASNSSSHLDVIINIESFSIYNIIGFTRPFVNIIDFPGFINNALKSNKISSELYFSTNFKNIVYHAPNIEIQNESLFGEFSLSGTDRQFNLNHGVIYLEDNIFLININSFINNRMDMTLLINASYQEVSWNIEGQFLDGNTLIIRDQNGFNVYGNVSSSADISGFIEIINYPVPIEANLVYLNLYSSLRYSSLDLWSFDISYFEMHDVNSINESSIRLSGYLDQNGAEFNDIVYNDRIGMLFGNANFNWNRNNSHLQFLFNMSNQSDINEYYSFEGEIKNRNINIEADISKMHINRFIRNINPMFISANTNIRWESINSFNVDIDVTEFTSNMQKTALNGTGNLQFTNDNIIANNIEVSFYDLKAEIPEIRIDREEGTALFDGNLKGLVQGKNFSTDTLINISFAKMNTWVDIPQIITQFNGNIHFNKFHYGDILHNKIDFYIEGNDEKISLNGGVDEMLRLEMDAAGDFYMGLSAPLPIRGSFAGNLSRDLYIDAHCNYFFIDLPKIYELATRIDSGIYFESGFVTGKLDIKGHVFNPEFFGQAKGSSITIMVPDFIADGIRAVPLNAVIEGYELTFEDVVTVCGTGGGIASGWLRFENWSPKNVGIEIAIPRNTSIPYNIDIGGFIATGDVSGMLNLYTHTTDYLVEVSGELFVDNTEMGLNMWDITSNQIVFNDTNNLTIVDLKITSGAQVEFFWPNRNNPIIKANPERGTVFYVVLDTQAQQYSLQSDINIRSGEITYLDRTFFIRQGTLYLNENEREFNPIISVIGEVRDRIDSEPVTISMIVENQPLLSFEPRFTANPSLTQLELYSLLGQNYNISDVENSEEVQRFIASSTADIVTQVIAMSDTFGQLVFLKQFERQARDFLNLDMLSIRTRIIQNTIAIGMTDLGRSEFPEVESRTEMRAGNYFDNSSVSIGKYIGQDMFLQGTMVMKYDENNDDFGGLTFEPDIGIEWRTPFVNIRWSFVPSNPQNWFVNDNSITLSWGKTF